MKDRIEGWTQEDEDSAFGLNGCERCWMGDDLPPEAQHLIMGLRRSVEKVLREDDEKRGSKIPREGPPPTADSLIAALDAHCAGAKAAGCYPKDLGLTGFILHEDGRRERWGK